MGKFVTPVCRRASLRGGENFYFLNKVGSLDEFGWDDSVLSSTSPSKLWRYNQHYFDYLNAVDAGYYKKSHLTLLQDWVVENPQGNTVGWDAYPTSLRIVNWVKWCFSGNTLPEQCVESLAIQAEWLMVHLERHILGNHLFANAKALIFAGSFFSGDKANSWLQQGLEIVQTELSEQILSDGGNFERSPMYHSIFWEDMLDLINLSQAYPEVLPTKDVVRWRAVTSSMQVWLQNMAHPDGEITFFNDAAFGIAASPAELTEYAKCLGLVIDRPNFSRKLFLKDSGYIRLASSKAVAFLDVAPIGPDYQPGHAHADTLSFELSLFGQRVVTNGGTSEYGKGTVRQEERSTSAHSTVSIDGQNSSEVWGGFRVARRAYPFGLMIEEIDDLITVKCSHDGYMRLKGKPIHQREWRFLESSLQITDTVSGFPRHAVARFHLHPAIKIVHVDRQFWKLFFPNGESAGIEIDQGHAVKEQSFFSCEFGRRLSRSCLAVSLIENRSQVRFFWGDNH